MPEQPLKVRQFQSLDDFRQWWWSEEVTQFCKDHPDQVDALKNHRFVKPYLDELERETSAGAEQQSAAPQPTGKTFGKYTLEKKLGQGGMGAVYLAFDPALNRRVALKVMTLKGMDAVERFQREARASAKLKHPNITPVYEVGTLIPSDKRGQGVCYYYFTMEYVEGVSLDAQIRDKGKSPNHKRTAEIIRDIASALDYAHKQQIIHRDIKPANILMDKAGRPYLTDFGLAKETTGLEKSLTLSGTVVGTPDYMSPEQARGEKRLDHRSDIFSLGATLYHSLTGQVPFMGKELYQVMEQVVHKDPLPPSRLVNALPLDLETICLKSMEKEPGKRYQNAALLADDLTRFLKGDVIRARPISTAEKIWRKVRQNKIASFGVAAGIGLLAVGLIISHLVSSSATAGKLDEYRKEAYKYFDVGKFEDAKAACDKVLDIAYDIDINELRDKCVAGIKKREKEGREKDAQADAIRKQAELRARTKAVLDRMKLSDTPDDKIKTAQDAIKIDPTFSDAWQVIGYAYRDKADYDKAYEAFSQAIKFSPTIADLYYERGNITANQRADLKGAILDFESVIKYNPDSPIGCIAKGIVAYYRKDYDKAISSYTTAEELLQEPFKDVDTADMDEENIVKALSSLGDIRDLSFKITEIYINRGVAYYAKAESLREQLSPTAYQVLLDKAIIGYNKVIEAVVITKNELVYYNRGIAYAGKQYYRLAIKDGEQFLKLAPNHPQANEMRKLIAEWQKKLK